MNPGRIPLLTALRFRWTAARRDEGGSLSVWVAATGVIVVLALGLSVDEAGDLHARENAHDIAAQAARAGGQEVQAAPAIEGTGLLINPYAARAAAEQYLTSAGLTGTVTVTGDLITVTVHEGYPTTFLGLIGIDHLTVTATATAHLIRTLGGTQQ